MKNYMLMMVLLFAASVLLMGCGDDGTEAADTPSIPEDLIKETNSDGKPTELEDRMDLELGEKGYLLTARGERPVAVTLNRVEKLYDDEEDRLYLIGDFTLKNLSDVQVRFEEPDVAVPSQETAILNDELEKGDMIGLGHTFFEEDGQMPEERVINDVVLEPGEEMNRKILISMRDSGDEYIIFFGLSNRFYGDYLTKAGWPIQPNQIADY